MPRYDFVSPGAMAGNAIEQFLMQREQEEMQRQEMAFRQQQAQEQAQRQAAQLALQQQQESRIGEFQQQQQADLVEQRNAGRAANIYENRLPGVIDQGTVDFIRKYGYDLPTEQGQPTQGEHLGVDENSVDQYAVTPGILQTSGGAKYQGARVAAQERAAQAAEAQRAAAERAAEAEAGKNERAQESNELRAIIAGAANAGRAETTGLRNDLLRRDIAAKDEKAADKQKADKRSRDAARVTAGATVDVLKELADFDEQGRATLKPEAQNLFGMRNPLAQYMPGSKTATAKGALDRLKGRAIVDLLNEMKNQSATGATGFGALSGPELKLLENAATELNSANISDTRAAAELERIYRMARQLYGEEPAQDTMAPGPGQTLSAAQLIEKYRKK
jgi:hypothetical protein